MDLIVQTSVHILKDGPINSTSFISARSRKVYMPLFGSIQGSWQCFPYQRVKWPPKLDIFHLQSFGLTKDTVSKYREGGTSISDRMQKAIKLIFGAHQTIDKMVHQNFQNGYFLRIQESLEGTTICIFCSRNDPKHTRFSSYVDGIYIWVIQHSWKWRQTHFKEQSQPDNQISMCFELCITNNEVDYEATILDITLVTRMGAKSIKLRTDFHLVILQIIGEAQTKQLLLQWYVILAIGKLKSSKC